MLLFILFKRIMKNLKKNILQLLNFSFIIFILFLTWGHYFSFLKKNTITYNDSSRIRQLYDVRIFDIDDDSWVTETLNQLSLEEKVAQMIFPYADAKGYSKEGAEYDRLINLTSKIKVGGFLLFRGSVDEQINLINDLQSISKVPLLFSADFENGVTQRIPGGTTFPSMMALGAANDLSLTYKMGEIIAIETKSFGIHQNYAPVSDINNNPLNPIINTRSFGESSHLVSKHTNAYIKGLQKGGIIATSKHFPGHGNTQTDSHSELPILNTPKSTLRKIELAPFKANIKSGVMSIMVGHLGLTAIDKDSILPATLSKNIISNLLKKELGFKGLIVTDAMNMKAITNRYSNKESAVLSVIAGNDIVLFPKNDEESFNGILEAVKSGRISEERINYSVKKILLAKRWAGLDTTNVIDINTTKEAIGRGEYFSTAYSIAEKSITLVKNENNLLPLIQNPNIKYRHIAFLDNNNTSNAFRFNNFLLERIPSLNSNIVKSDASQKEINVFKDSLSKDDIFIISVYIRVRDLKGNLELSILQNDLIKDILKLKRPTLLVSHGDPYILGRYPDVDAFICNYGENFVSEKSLSASIFGESDISGTLPVSISSTDFRFGTSIKLKQSVLSERIDKIKYHQLKNFKLVDKLMEKAVQDSVFPGAALMIINSNNIVYNKAFGKFTYSSDSKKVVPNTVFDLASVTKVIATTTAAMICYDKGLFALDDKVIKYIPEFNNNSKDAVTIRHLLLHNSGLPSFKPFYKNYSTAKEVISDIFNSSLNSKPGTKYVYSDLGMITMGKIIERVSGMSLDKFCSKEIFSQLGMTNTFFNPSTEVKCLIPPTENDTYWRNRLLQGEVHDEASSLLNGVAGHAGLFSNTKDIAILLQMLMQNGFYQGKQFIRRGTVELFTRKHSDDGFRALGWGIKGDNFSSAGSLFSNKSFGHTGYTGTSVWVDPENNTIVILLSNRVHPSRENNKLSKFRPKLHDMIFNSLFNPSGVK